MASPAEKTAEVATLLHVHVENKDTENKQPPAVTADYSKFRIVENKAEKRKATKVHSSITASMWASRITTYMNTLSVMQLCGVMFFCITLINLFFAVLYNLHEDGCCGNDDHDFQESFFFSVQTFSTIGYGALAPKGTYINIIVFFEGLLSMTSITMLSGLVISQFFRPLVQLEVSHSPVICNHDQVPTLKIRLANLLGTHRIILNMQVSIYMLRLEKNEEGHGMRRMRPVNLSLTCWPRFNSVWTLMHPITADNQSPFFGEGPASLAKSEAFLHIMLTGVDVATQASFCEMRFVDCTAIQWGADFYSMVEFDKAQNILTMDFKYMNAVVPAMVYMRADETQTIVAVENKRRMSLMAKEKSRLDSVLESMNEDVYNTPGGLDAAILEAEDEMKVEAMKQDAFAQQGKKQRSSSLPARKNNLALPLSPAIVIEKAQRGKKACPGIMKDGVMLNMEDVASQLIPRLEKSCQGRSRVHTGTGIEGEAQVSKKPPSPDKHNHDGDVLSVPSTPVLAAVSAKVGATVEPTMVLLSNEANPAEHVTSFDPCRD